MIGSMTVFSVGLLIKVYFLVFKDGSTRRFRGRSGTEDNMDFGASAIPLEIADGPDQKQKDKPHSSYFCNGFYEGLVLISRHKYTWLLLAVSTLYEVVLTVLDYEFKLSGARYSSISITPTLEVNYLTHYHSLSCYDRTVLHGVGAQTFTSLTQASPRTIISSSGTDQ
jgi:hypothetical protein